MLRVVHFPLLLLSFATSRCLAGKNQHELLVALLSREGLTHSIIERPALDDNDTVTVRIAFNLQQVISLDAKEQYLVSSMWIEHTWYDPTLQWDPAFFGNITTTKIPVKLIWRPDILLYNSADEKYDGTWPVNAVIRYDGEVSYIPPAFLRSTCKVNVEWFPFDEQHCMLKFGSWTYQDKEVNITLAVDPVMTKNLLENGEFRIQAHASRYDHIYSYGLGHSENYPYVALCFHLKRRDLYYIFNLIIPVMLIMFLSLLVFLLPTESGEKMGLSVTILLSLTVYSSVVSESTPRTSEAVPIIGLYFLVIMIICAAVVGTQVWSIKINYDACRKGLSRWEIYWICIRLAKLIRYEIPEEILILSKHELELITKKNKMPTLRAEVNNKCGNIELINSGFRFIDSDMATDFSQLQDELVKDGNAIQLRMCANLQKLTKDFEKLISKIEEKNEGAHQAAICAFASAVVDRACLYLFSTITVVVAALILTWRPPVYEGARSAGDICVPTEI